MPPRAKPKAPADDGQEDSPAESKAVSKPKGKTRAKVGEGDDNDAAPAQGLSEEKLPLPAWLKMFTERGVDMRLAMTLAAKLYSTMGSPALIGKLTGPKMMEVGITDKDQKRAVTNAIRGLKLAAKGTATTTSSGKRKRANDGDLLNPLIPGDPSLRRGKQAVEYDVSDFDFKESHDIESIRAQTVVTNRAPCMTAWAYIICEKMGFDRLEALSLASTFTSITSTKHALALGNIYDPQQTRDAQLEMDELPQSDSKRFKGSDGRANGTGESGHSQPWVSIMKRRPVIKRADGTWRGVLKGMPVEPYRAHSYITRNFRDATPYVIGALRILSQCYTVDELNEQGYGMYVSFRPDVEGWGDRATLYCSNIVDMIPPEKEVQLVEEGGIVSLEEDPKDSVKMVMSGTETVKEEDLLQAEREDAADVEQFHRPKEEGGFIKTEREDVFEGLAEAEYDD
ncbi:hypothetical protein NliqN6_6471 [Naganishia liquefaciens]|uniref:Uncharacterized protein n=1 Tax=Naganishia liquefaciens TaxID=104408 RepID=A0A8H3YHN0_9TREE|nr:hypothetical protein NliqN6_6471 [Naganishia liquefaciens]